MEIYRNGNLLKQIRFKGLNSEHNTYLVLLNLSWQQLFAIKEELLLSLARLCPNALLDIWVKKQKTIWNYIWLQIPYIWLQIPYIWLQNPYIWLQIPYILLQNPYIWLQIPYNRLQIPYIWLQIP